MTVRGAGPCPGLSAGYDIMRQAGPASELPQRTETILLAEDEEGVRTATTKVLQMMGYTVLPARNGQEAVDLAAGHHARIDLLLTDVIMPGMNGAQLRDGLKKVRPGLKVLFMSGYSDDVISREGVLVPGTHYMPKPFTMRVLAGAVRHAIGW